MQLEEQLHEKKVDAVFTDPLRKHLSKKGFDPLMGARPMQRLIQDTIRKALADELLFGRLVGGGRVTVDLDDAGEVVLTFGESGNATGPAAGGGSGGHSAAGVPVDERRDGESAEPAETATV
jgi:ATP-dependent Clp protease ATP-binding subunit ClpA